MPRGYRVHEREMGNLYEQVLGRGDEKRATKTYIENGSLAMFLGMVRAFPESVINAGRRLHAEQTQKPLSEIDIDDFMDLYPEAREFIEMFEWILQTKGSQEGFLVDRALKHASNEELEDRPKKRESSGEVTGSKGGERWR